MAKFTSLTETEVEDIIADDESKNRRNCITVTVLTIVVAVSIRPITNANLLRCERITRLDAIISDCLASA